MLSGFTLRSADFTFKQPTKLSKSIKKTAPLQAYQFCKPNNDVEEEYRIEFQAIKDTMNELRKMDEPEAPVSPKITKKDQTQ